jgi:hypothetical protein
MCPAGWSVLEGSQRCYKTFKASSAIKYFEAQGRCRLEHPQADLAKIESEIEMNGISALMKVPLTLFILN